MDTRGPTYDLSWETNHAWEQLEREEVLFMDEQQLGCLFRLARPRGFYRLYWRVDKEELVVEPWPTLADAN